MFFKFLNNHHGNTIYIKKSFNFWNDFYTFKVATTKFSWNFTMFEESFDMFKTLKKSMWTCGFLFQKKFFLIKCSPNHFKKFWTLIYSIRKDSYVQNIQKIKIHICFYSNILKHYYNFEFVIMVQSKVINLTIIEDLMQEKLSLYYVICHIWPQIWYYVWKLCEKWSKN